MPEVTADRSGYVCVQDRNVYWEYFGREAAHDPWGPKLSPGEFEEIGETLRALGKI